MVAGVTYRTRHACTLYLTGRRAMVTGHTGHCGGSGGGDQRGGWALGAGRYTAHTSLYRHALVTYGVVCRGGCIIPSMNRIMSIGRPALPCHTLHMCGVCHREGRVNVVTPPCKYTHGVYMAYRTGRGVRMYPSLPVRNTPHTHGSPTERAERGCCQHAIQYCSCNRYSINAAHTVHAHTCCRHAERERRGALRTGGRRRGAEGAVAAAQQRAGQGRAGGDADDGCGAAAGVGEWARALLLGGLSVLLETRNCLHSVFQV